MAKTSVVHYIARVTDLDGAHWYLCRNGKPGELEWRRNAEGEAFRMNHEQICNYYFEDETEPRPPLYMSFPPHFPTSKLEVLERSLEVHGTHPDPFGTAEVSISGPALILRLRKDLLSIKQIADVMTVINMAGWQLVPRKPTDAMVNAMQGAAPFFTTADDAKRAWSRALETSMHFPTNNDKGGDGA